MNMSSKDLEKKEKKKSMVEQNISKIMYSNGKTSEGSRKEKEEAQVTKKSERKIELFIHLSFTYQRKGIK